MGAIGAITQKFGKALGGLLFPPACPSCRRLVARPGDVCASCWPSLRFLEEPWCEIMGTPFAHDMGDGILSADAIANPPPFARARAAVTYDGVARRLVHALKYEDQPSLAPAMARWMARPGAELLAECEVITPVPLHWTRMARRRFNQSAELARALAAQNNRPLAPLAVERIKSTRQQVGLGLREREDNVRAAFRVPDARQIEISGRRVLLVDDVYTTGATVRAVAKTLIKRGAAAVDVLTFARVLPGDFRPDEPETI